MNIYGAITEKLEMMRSQKQPLTLGFFKINILKNFV